MKDPRDALSIALEAAWPGGVPEQEAMLAGRLSKELRDVVAERLRVVDGWTRENEEDRPSAAEAAAALGLSKQRFYAVAAEWRTSNSIASMGARASEKRTRPPRLGADVLSVASTLIREALREDPRSSVASIERRLIAAGVPSMSYATVRRLLFDAKRNAPSGPFGAELVLDSVGLDAVSDGQRMRLYVVLDRGTGCVLGAAEATNRTGIWGYVHAADDARTNMDRMDLAGLSAATEEPRVLLHPQRDDDAGGRVLESRLASAGTSCTMISGSTGSVALEVLGERIGDVWAGIGERDDQVSYRHGRPARMPEYTAATSIAVMKAIDEHNRRRLAVPGTDPSPAASLERARASVSQALAVIGGSVAELEALPCYREAHVHERRPV